VSRDVHTVEGIARVVGVDPDGGAWLEPEQTTSCGHCASADVCGSKGVGTVASRLEARRFHIDSGAALHVGDRVVVGVDDGALLKGALIAYAIPLLVCFVTGGIAQAIGDSDLITMASMATGLAAGVLIARIAARRLGRTGNLAPRLLRLLGGSGGFDATICEAMRSSESPAPAALRRQQQVTQ
jgi:sigma-E factor negative regulatory protein RseC